MLLSKLKAREKSKGGPKSGRTSGQNQRGNHVSKCETYDVLFFLFLLFVGVLLQNTTK